MLSHIRKMPWRGFLRALSYRDFAVFYTGQGISLVGTWMQQAAASWLIYRLTNSAFLLGVYGFASQLPVFFLSPFAGAVADRYPKRDILLVSQCLFAVQASVLAYLSLSGTVAAWHLIALGFVSGCINAFEIPVRQSFIIELVRHKDNLGNAIALNSFMFNLARLIGPSVAGAVIVFVGEGACFFANAVSFVAPITSLLLIRRRPVTHPRAQDVVKGIVDGFRYVLDAPALRDVLILLSITNMAGMANIVLMPVFARDVLGGGPGMLGGLMASASVGSILATVYLATKRSVRMGRALPVSNAIFSCGLILFGLSANRILSFVCLAIAGFGLMVAMATSNTILQTLSSDEKRVRVMSLYVMAFMGLAPIGSAGSGLLADICGARLTLVIGGVITLAVSGIFALRLPILKVHAARLARASGWGEEVQERTFPS